MGRRLLDVLASLGEPFITHSLTHISQNNSPVSSIDPRSDLTCRLLFHLAVIFCEFKMCFNICECGYILRTHFAVSGGFIARWFSSCGDQKVGQKEDLAWLAGIWGGGRHINTHVELCGAIYSLVLTKGYLYIPIYFCFNQRCLFGMHTSTSMHSQDKEFIIQQTRWMIFNRQKKYVNDKS